MSFILDALKKSESERQKQAGPALFEVRVAAPRSGVPPWAVVAGVALGVAAAVIVVLLWRGDSRGTPDAATGTGTTPASGAASTSGGPATLAATAATPDVPGTSQSAAPAALSSAASAGAAPPGGAAPVSRYNPPLVDDPAADPGADADELPGDRTPALPAGGADMPGAYTSSGPAAPAAVNGRSHSTGLPSRDDLLATGQQIPEVQLNLHVYDAKTASRFVIVNGQRTREGEVLANGVRVDEVTPDGAVMSYRGARFLLPIQ